MNAVAAAGEIARPLQRARSRQDVAAMPQSAIFISKCPSPGYCL
jgi:hypothetical protein